MQVPRLRRNNFFGIFFTSIVARMNGPWLLADFNSILDSLERIRGALTGRTGCRWFLDFLFSNSLHDLGVFGARFTSCRGGLSQRLD